MSKIIYYDIETIGLDPKTDIKRVKSGYNAKKTGRITSVVFKEQGKPAEAYTIGVNVKSNKEMLKAIKPYFKSTQNLLIGWNSTKFDDPVVKAHIGKSNFKCKVFDLMSGYGKFVTRKSESLSLNTIAQQLGKAKEDVNPVYAFETKQYQLLQDYNIVDVNLLEEIDAAYHITEMLDIMMDTTGVTDPSKLLFVTPPLKSYIHKNDIKLGTNKRNNFGNFGGLNYFRSKGRWDDVRHFDVRSFYPYMFLCLNASSNLNYTNLKSIEVSNTDGLQKFGNLWFNDDATIQVKQKGDAFVGVQLVSDFDIKAGNSDIKRLVSELVNYKNNTTGDLRDAYKVLVNGVYGALDSNYFDFKHRNLSSACTFMCRLVLYRCIRQFKGVYAKTDSIWCKDATEEALNEFTANLLEGYGLDTLDTDGSYLIQWELEANVETLYIKDKNNYLEQIGGNWFERGSFEVPLQKDILYAYIENPNLDIRQWVEDHISDVKGWCQYKTLSEKQKHHISQDISFSKELGLSYMFGFKNYRYYTEDLRYINTIELNDKMPPVNFDYAMNLATKKLKEYGFKVKVHPFNARKPKKNAVNASSDIDETTNLDNFNQPVQQESLRFNSLNECLKYIFEDYGLEHRQNNLKLSMMGAAYRMGYNICPAFNKAKNELGIYDSSKLAHEDHLRDDRYGYTNLVKLIDKELADEFTRLVKEELKPMKKQKSKTTDNYMDRIRLSSSDRRELDNIIDEYRLYDKRQDLYYHLNVGEWEVNLRNTQGTMINYNWQDLLFDLNIQVEADENISDKKQKIIKRKKQDKVRAKLQEIYKRLQDKIHKELSIIVEDYRYNDLLKLFERTWVNTAFPLAPLLEEMALLMGNKGVIQQALGESGNLKSNRSHVELNTLPSVIVMDDTTIAALSRNCMIKGVYYLDNTVLYYNDVGDDTSMRRNFEELLESVYKKLYSEGYIKREITQRNGDGILRLNLRTPHGFKLKFNTVKPVFKKDNGQTASRIQTYIRPELTIEDSKGLTGKGKPVTAIDPRYFKYIFREYMQNKTPKDFTNEEIDELKQKAYEDNNNKVNLHKEGDLIYTCEQMSILYGDLYYEKFYKPQIIDTKTTPKKALELKDNIAKMVKVSFDLEDVEQLNHYEMNYTIAQSKSSYKNASKYNFDAFTITAVINMSVAFIRKNKGDIPHLITVLKDNDEIYKVGNIDNYNVYVLLKDSEDSEK